MPTEIPNPRVVVLRGGQVLAEHELPPDGELVVGRTPQCQVSINDSTVSRMHLRLYADGQGVYLEDLGSANGTFVDGERVMGVVRLSDGQLVRPGQKALAQPTVLRFEDPAKRLLESMGLLGTRDSGAQAAPGQAAGPGATVPAGTTPVPVVLAAPAPPAPPAARSAEARPPAAPARPNGESRPAPATQAATASQGAPPPPAPPAEHADDEPPVPRRRRSAIPVLVAAGLVGLLLLAGFLYWVSRVLKPASAQWETVELSSYEVSPGEPLELRSSEIAPTDPLRVLFGDLPVEGAQPLQGRLVFTVPTLTERPAGSYPVTLVVREGDLDVFSATVNYSVRPTLARVEPAELHVGEVLTIHGTALPDSPAGVQVMIGDQPGEVVEATSTRLRVRVPLLTRKGIVQVPLTVKVGDWEGRPEHELLISPRQDQPLDFLVRAQHRADAGVWELTSPLGSLFLLGAPAPGPDGAPPATVREVQEKLRALFAEAARDPGLRVEAAPASGRYRLRAVATGGRSWILVELSEADLLATARARRIDTSAEVFAFWMARVWNHLLDTFSRGVKPPGVAGGPPYLTTLARLVDVNQAAGGSGRPDATDLERLGVGERAALADAFLSVPAGYGSVTGSWTARLQNVFYPEDDYVVELRLDLKQRGRSLSGSGEVALQGQGMSFGVPPSSVTGSVQPGVPPKVRLRLVFNRPVGELELEGVLESGSLAGTFRSSLAEGEGTWQAVRLQQEAAQAQTQAPTP